MRTMAVCQICGKGPQFGHNVSFSKRHTNRVYRPNVQTATILVDGRPTRVAICTRCLRTLNKA